MSPYTHPISPGSKLKLQIIIGGDSAGGNLALGLLLHLLHPHPSIAPIELFKPLCGAFVSSPWGEFDTSAPSYTRNQAKDLLKVPTLKRWAAAFLGGAEGDEYNQPFRAPLGWWADLPSKVEAMLVTTGADELMADDVEQFSQTVAVCAVTWNLSSSRY